MIQAKIICDSVNPQGNRLTTFRLVYPKFIHGELMTHRVFSRNASSSRAIPVAKLIAEVRDDATRAGPVYWGGKQRGMQSGAELDNVTKSMSWKDRFDTVEGAWEPVTPREYAQRVWRFAAYDAADRAELMLRAGVHKSIVNRLLEPFSHIHVIVSATEYDNFFGLRLDKAADPTIHALAEAMWREYNEYKPRMLQPGEWHLPFIDAEDIETIKRDRWMGTGDSDLGPIDAIAVRVSVARCARVSYESFETGKRSTVEEDLKLYERLVGAQPLHASPAEHQATPDIMVLNMNVPLSVPTDYGYPTGSRPGDWLHPQDHGNLVGWRQYRKMLPGEDCAPLPLEYRK